MRPSITALLLSSALLWGSACQPDAPSVPTEEFPVDENLPPAVVDLPAPPPASAFEIREKNDDDTLRVEGLVGYRERYLDQDVVVRAVVTEIKGDCDPGRAKKRGEFCPQPHLMIRDDADARHELMAVGYTNDFLKKIRLKAGESYEFKGTYQLMADGFVSSENGLIELKAVGEHEVPQN
ncbi:hypothetical protein DL240_04240 [Lujinxingia litoralis]|uniref:Lipoprotein n=1 Tax=Lujinxingia litoralis TaxID=2211119 RepID=A0A328CCH9_9DELT|nr:hypothetical protein [Lujinxingia litoralis]RAL25426.1 hypothetical protein DL240_04240 [Lujinxingia litoralis]